MVKGNSICIRTYLRPELFAEIAGEAEKAGKRKKGLLLYTAKPHGFANEKLANTDGIAKFLKFCYDYYKKAEPARLKELADILQQEKELQELKRQKGLPI